ncbi:hypothetical protein [Flavobacterium caeni]|uniref:Uncharacterized protein n=1 Tax=Flavobacterium caeni TaxID=490189 RepID=A0A1G5BPA6_9FLAO|nr:hypothetical protein [Flavobacterium caeni]SCX92035.1 hypothetical protein SAMN02927903_00440 [Flavobacterium caeni]
MSQKENFPHILNASSTLLGLCFVVLTSLKLRDNSETSVIDELTAGAIFIFLTSSILSYLSMRNDVSSGKKYEKIADIAFLCGLVLLCVITVLITLNLVD